MNKTFFLESFLILYQQVCQNIFTFPEVWQECKKLWTTVNLISGDLVIIYNIHGISNAHAPFEI